ncbi:MAG: hypothetical protein ACXVMI_02775 [Flavisolibacter sp.]
MSRTCPASYKGRDIYGASTGGIWDVLIFGYSYPFTGYSFSTWHSNSFSWKACTLMGFAKRGKNLAMGLVGLYTDLDILLFHCAM